MSDYETRLLKCFGAVFPGLSETQLRSANTTRVENWDSVATVTLITLIEEEFNIEVEAEDLEALVSFSSVLEYLQRVQPTRLKLG
jgi:acyl carrier protein